MNEAAYRPVALSAGLGRFFIPQLGNWTGMAIELPDKFTLHREADTLVEIVGSNIGRATLSVMVPVRRARNS